MHNEHDNEMREVTNGKHFYLLKSSRYEAKDSNLHL